MVYVNGGKVNYQPIEPTEVKKNSYYEKFKRRKSKSPYESKSPDKYSQIVRKFNETKNKPMF